MSLEDTLKLIKDSKAQFVDLRFTDTKGKEQHISLPIGIVDEKIFEYGEMFDGSSISGWKGINESDMILMPDPNSAVLDPFTQMTTMNLRCDVIDPSDMQGYNRDPRSIAKKAESYLKSTKIGDKAYFGPENEFFLFDSVHWEHKMGSAFYKIYSSEAAWSSAKKYKHRNIGHRPGIKGGYFPVSPVDSQSDVRSVMCSTMEAMGLHVEVHHHEVGTAGQGEIGTEFNTLVNKADEIQIFKYVVHNVAHNHGLTATFMPKPIIGDNGSGMHVNQSIFKSGVNMFTGEHYGGLSKIALYYIGGIFKHAKALNAFTNASTNSYKRLTPGFEAPVLLAYSVKNRSAACRVPYVINQNNKRIEIRFPDSTANPYLAFSAILMAGLDGIQNKIHPGTPMDQDLYALPQEKKKNIETVAQEFDVALEALDHDRNFLLEGKVFSNDAIDAYINLKMEEVDRLRMATHPVEFDMYYSV